MKVLESYKKDSVSKVKSVVERIDQIESLAKELRISIREIQILIQLEILKKDSKGDFNKKDIDRVKEALGIDEITLVAEDIPGTLLDIEDLDTDGTHRHRLAKTWGVSTNFIDALCELQVLQKAPIKKPYTYLEV